MSTGPRGPYARSAVRRREIADAVLGLVREVGHAGVTTAEVAARAGTSEATVLYHHPSRDHLLVAALARADELAGDDHPSDEQAVDPGFADRLAGHVTASVQGDAPVVRLYVMLAGHAATPGHPAADFFADHYRATVAVYSRLVRARQAAGLAHPGLDPEQTARQLVAAWDGLQAQWVVDGNFDLAAAVSGAFRRLTGQGWAEALRLLRAEDVGL